MTATMMDLTTLAANAARVADMLKLLANKPRLMVMCRLAECGELRVGDLADHVGLSQSALSQHLARLREDRLVEPRRDGTTIWYRIADPRCAELLETLHRLYCPGEPQ